MSHVPGGLVYKKVNNVLRPVADSGDPFWADVILMAPFDGSGTAPLDYSVLNNNPVNAYIPSLPSVYSQNSVQTFNGKNTLEGKLVVEQGGFLYQGPNDNNFGTNSTCIEFFYKQTAFYNGTGSPPIIRFLLNWNQLFFIRKYSTGQRIDIDSPWTTFSFNAPNFSVWNYFCAQYVNGTNRVYLYHCDESLPIAAKIGELVLFSQVSYIDFQVKVFYDVVGPSLQSNTAYLSNLRITKANRYGNVPSFPIAFKPFPLHG